MVDKEKRKKRILDKVIMGAVIGGAIGSVLGATVAPQEGKKTREELKEVAASTGRGLKKIFNKIKKLLGRKSSMKKIPHEPPAEENHEEIVDTTDHHGFFKDKP